MMSPAEFWAVLEHKKEPEKIGKVEKGKFEKLKGALAKSGGHKRVEKPRPSKGERKLVRAGRRVNRAAKARR